MSNVVPSVAEQASAPARQASLLTRALRASGALLRAAGEAMAPQLTYPTAQQEHDVALAGLRTTTPYREKLGIEDAPAVLIEKQGFVCQAPQLPEQAADVSRVNTFVHRHSPKPTGDPNYGLGSLLRTTRTITEHEGLVHLRDFLQRNSQNDLAPEMLERLTIVGEKEYQEAVKGIAAYWKQYLDTNPDKQLCVLSLVTSTVFSRWLLKPVKSDRYMLDRVLQEFSDEELKSYAGRLLINTTRGLDPDPDMVRIAIVDDWVISGAQMREAIAYAEDDLALQDYVQSMEVNTLIASERQLADKIAEVPYKTYFLIEGEKMEHHGRPMLTGTHSTVDAPFQGQVLFINKASTPLAEVIRPYKYSPMPQTRHAQRLTRPTLRDLYRKRKSARQ